MTDSAAAFEEGDRRAYSGWLVGVLVILAVMVIGAAFWFRYHP